MHISSFQLRSLLICSLWKSGALWIKIVVINRQRSQGQFSFCKQLECKIRLPLPHCSESITCPTIITIEGLRSRTSLSKRLQENLLWHLSPAQLKVQWFLPATNHKGFSLAFRTMVPSYFSRLGLLLFSPLNPMLQRNWPATVTGLFPPVLILCLSCLRQPPQLAHLCWPKSLPSFKDPFPISLIPLFIFFKVGSMLKVGLEVMTLRWIVTYSSDWASQAPLLSWFLITLSNSAKILKKKKNFLKML